MSESSSETAETDPTDTPHGGLGDLDPEQLVGEPPAGDDSPGELASRDQQPGSQDSRQDSSQDEGQDA